MYHNQSIDISLYSDNPVVRLFAIMDKRTGNKRLQKIISEVENQPEWLQFFYRLHLETNKVYKKS